MKKNILPILLIAGGVAIYYAMRKKKSTVTAEMPIRQTAEQYAADYAQTVKPTILDKASDAVKNIFTSPAKQKAAKAAQAAAVKKAVAKGITKKKAVAVTKKLSTFSFPRIGGDEIMF